MATNSLSSTSNSVSGKCFVGRVGIAFSDRMAPSSKNVRQCTGVARFLEHGRRRRKAEKEDRSARTGGERNRHGAFEAFGFHCIGQLELIERLPYGDERRHIEPRVSAALIHERGADFAACRDLEVDGGGAFPALFARLGRVLDVPASGVGQATQVLVGVLARTRTVGGRGRRWLDALDSGNERGRLVAALSHQYVLCRISVRERAARALLVRKDAEQRSVRIDQRSAIIAGGEP